MLEGRVCLFGGEREGHMAREEVGTVAEWEDGALGLGRLHFYSSAHLPGGMEVPATIQRRPSP